MSPMLVKAAIAGLAKGVAAIVGITLTAILARVLGADEAGLFFLGLSLLMGLSVVFRLGLDDLVLRAMGAEYLSVACQSKLNTGLIWIVVATEYLSFRRRNLGGGFQEARIRRGFGILYVGTSGDVAIYVVGVSFPGGAPCRGSGRVSEPWGKRYFLNSFCLTFYS